MLRGGGGNLFSGDRVSALADLGALEISQSIGDRPEGLELLGHVSNNSKNYITYNASQ